MRIDPDGKNQEDGLLRHVRSVAKFIRFYHDDDMPQDRPGCDMRLLKDANRLFTELSTARRRSASEHDITGCVFRSYLWNDSERKNARHQSTPRRRAGGMPPLQIGPGGPYFTVCTVPVARAPLLKS